MHTRALRKTAPGMAERLHSGSDQEQWSLRTTAVITTIGSNKRKLGLRLRLRLIRGIGRGILSVVVVVLAQRRGYVNHCVGSIERGRDEYDARALALCGVRSSRVAMQ